jgi:hypothetical protein
MEESERTDPLGMVPAPEADRTFYADGVLLGADDFRVEQTYHRGRLARALGILSGGGTVYGLRIARQIETVMDDNDEVEEEQIHVEPGVAIDRLGRLIEVPRSMCIRLSRWLEQQRVDFADYVHGGVMVEHEHDLSDDVRIRGVVVELFLRFAVCEVGRTPAFRTGPLDALDATTPERLRDSGAIEPVLRRTGSLPDPQDPWPSIPPADVPRTLILDWRSTLGVEEDGSLQPRSEHGLVVDPSWVWIGRVVKPAVVTGTSETIDWHAPARIAQRNRPLAVPIGVVAALAGL